MPDHVVGQTKDAVAGALGHLGEAFCLGLVLEGVAWKVDAYLAQKVSTECAASRNSIRD